MCNAEMIELEQLAIGIAAQDERRYGREFDMAEIWQRRDYRRAEFRRRAVAFIKLQLTRPPRERKTDRVYLPTTLERKRRRAELERIRRLKPENIAKRRLAYANRSEATRAKEIERGRLRGKSPAHHARRRELYANRTDAQRERDRIKDRIRYERRKARLTKSQEASK